MLKQTKVFIDSLLEWNQETEAFSVIDFETLLFVLGFKIGADMPVGNKEDEDSIKVLSERIKELTTNHSMHEDFLIMALVRTVDEEIENSLMTHGKTIVSNEKMLEELKNRGREEMTDVVYASLEKQKETTYFYNAQRALDHWRVITAKRFGGYQRTRWTENVMMSKMKSMTSLM